MPTETNINNANINKDIVIRENDLFAIYAANQETIDLETVKARQETRVIDAIDGLGISVLQNALPSDGYDSTMVTYKLKREMPDLKARSLTVNSNTQVLPFQDLGPNDIQITTSPVEKYSYRALMTFEEKRRQEAQQEIIRGPKPSLYNEWLKGVEQNGIAITSEAVELEFLLSLKTQWNFTKTIKKPDFTASFERYQDTFNGNFIKQYFGTNLDIESFHNVARKLNLANKRRIDNKLKVVFFGTLEMFNHIMTQLYTRESITNMYTLKALNSAQMNQISAGFSVQSNLQAKNRITGEQFGTEFDFENGMKFVVLKDQHASILWNPTRNQFDMLFITDEAYEMIDIITPTVKVGYDMRTNMHRQIAKMSRFGYLVQEMYDKVGTHYLDSSAMYTAQKMSIVPRANMDKAGFIPIDNSFMGNQTAINALKTYYDEAYNALYSTLNSTDA